MARLLWLTTGALAIAALASHVHDRPPGADSVRQTELAARRAQLLLDYTTTYQVLDESGALTPAVRDALTELAAQELALHAQLPRAP